jgi:hypothetical protein
VFFIDQEFCVLESDKATEKVERPQPTPAAAAIGWVILSRAIFCNLLPV